MTVDALDVSLICVGAGIAEGAGGIQSPNVASPSRSSSLPRLLGTGVGGSRTLAFGLLSPKNPRKRPFAFGANVESENQPEKQKTRDKHEKPAVTLGFGPIETAVIQHRAEIHQSAAARKHPRSHEEDIRDHTEIAVSTNVHASVYVNRLIDTQQASQSMQLLHLNFALSLRHAR